MALQIVNLCYNDSNRFLGVRYWIAWSCSRGLTVCGVNGDAGVVKASQKTPIGRLAFPGVKSEPRERVYLQLVSQRAAPKRARYIVPYGRGGGGTLVSGWPYVSAGGKRRPALKNRGRGTQDQNKARRDRVRRVGVRVGEPVSDGGREFAENCAGGAMMERRMFLNLAAGGAAAMAINPG